MAGPSPSPGRAGLVVVDEFHLDTAAEFVCARVPRARPDDTAGAIRRAMLGVSYESADDVVVLDGERLCGLIRIEDLLAAPEDTEAAAIMDADPPVVEPGADQEEVAWKAVHHAESSLAVVDAGGHFLGLIPAWRLLGVLLEEHDEDVARLGGFLRSASTALVASEETVARRFWHRLPWLVIGLVGSVLAAGIVDGFEESLSRNVILAFFLPGIVYMADAVGTQTEALVIRGLSVGVSIGHVIVREVLTGVLIGLGLSALFFVIVWSGWGRADVALAVSLSLFAACSIATTVALGLPWVIDQFGQDPAFGSGSLATVIQDLLSIVLYLAITTALID